MAPEAEVNPEAINFKNPFPAEPMVDMQHLLRATMLVVEPIRWTVDLPNSVLDLICLEVHNTSRLLYQSTRIF